MRVWVICFVLFFGAAEFYQWMQGLTLPLPFFIVLGGLLAIASNSDKWGFTRQGIRLTQSGSTQSPPIETQNPPIPITSAPSSPVSFTIRKRKSATLPIVNQEKGAS
jgi:hypothetical protein